MTTALLYLRVSTARQAEEGVSLDMQEARGRALAASRGWTVGGVYRDDGISGTEDPTGRPGLQALLDAAKGDPDAVVVVYSISRLSRRQRLLWALLDPAKGKGLAVASVTEPFDTSTPMGRAMIGMIGVWAQLESDQTSERTKAALAHVRATGTRLGAKPMAELAPDAVARCKALAAEGLSLEAIAAALNDGGVPTATRRGKWWPKTVRSALAAGGAT